MLLYIYNVKKGGYSYDMDRTNYCCSYCCWINRTI